MAGRQPSVPLDTLLRRAQRIADGGVFWPADVHPGLKPETVKRRLKKAGYAVSAGDGFWVLTRAGGNSYYQGPEPNEQGEK